MYGDVLEPMCLASEQMFTFYVKSSKLSSLLGVWELWKNIVSNQISYCHARPIKSDAWVCRQTTYPKKIGKKHFIICSLKIPNLKPIVCIVLIFFIYVIPVPEILLRAG